MGDFAADVVQDVGLGDAVCGVGADGPHDGAEVAEEAPVYGAEGAAGERVRGGAVVREEGVGVLEEDDEDEPVVNPVNALVDIQNPWTETNQRYGTR